METHVPSTVIAYIAYSKTEMGSFVYFEHFLKRTRQFDKVARGIYGFEKSVENVTRTSMHELKFRGEEERNLRISQNFCPLQVISLALMSTQCPVDCLLHAQRTP